MRVQQRLLVHCDEAEHPAIMEAQLLVGGRLLDVCIRKAIAECMASTLIVTISMGCQRDGCSQE